MYAFGYPLERLRDVPAGDYYIQVLFHKYETFHLKDGHTVKLPMDRGEGQRWNQAPGNIYSTPIKVHFDPATSGEKSLTIDHIIPPIAEPQDTRYIKHVKIQSKLLSEFWGFDLTHIIQCDWPKIGDKLKGKIHIYVGDMDSYYLNNAVYSAEDMLKKLTAPGCSCEVDYGDRAEHCWNGDHEHPNYISRLRYHQMYIKKWAEEVKTRAPKGADLKSWRY